MTIDSQGICGHELKLKKMITIINITVGLLFFLQILGFYSKTEKFSIGLKFKRLGNEDMALIKNPKKGLVPALFGLASLICGIVLIIFSPHWVITLSVGIYILITLWLSENKRNYLGCSRVIITDTRSGGRIITRKKDVKGYLFHGPLWIFCEKYWSYGFL